MMKKTRDLNIEQGSIILMTLLIFFIVSILLMLILQLSSMEMHMSQYYFRSQQAQQLADATLEQRCAEINQCLISNYTNDKFLPDLPLGWRENWTELSTGSGQGRSQTLFLTSETGTDYCRYRLECVGCFENATKSVEADLTFHFTDNYSSKQKFISRTFLDKGKITSYKILNDI